MSTMIGKSLKNRYFIISLIQEGGMAYVYLAEDTINKKQVAVKIMKEETFSDPLNIARFQREARACASLRHPNIVEIYDIDEYKGKPYIVMEYVESKSLKDLLTTRGVFSPIEACDIIYQLADALMHAHEHGVIHRDIKPQNVMMKYDGTVKLLDFGIATISDAPNITQKDMVVGSVHYMAPEVLKGRGASPKSDIYSLGITFYELLIGKQPFNDNSPVNIAMKQIEEPLPSVHKLRNDVNIKIEKIINKACQKNPDNRYQSMKAFKHDLQNVMRVDITNGKGFFKRLFSKKDKENA